jgi:hypothetical protein
VNRAQDPSRRSILFAGGCHLEGYPVGEQSSFARVVLKSIPDYRQHFVHYLNLSSGDRLYEACNSLNPRFVVLQLGHYEAPRELGKVIRVPRLLNSNKGAGRLRAKAWTPDATQHFRHSLTWDFKAFVRFSVGFGMGVMNHPVFDKNKVRSSLRSILSQMPQALRDRTFLLSPFPCPDPLMRLYRLELREVFATTARQVGCHLVDTQSELLEREESPGDSRLYSDPYHLSAEGHAVVGELLAETLLSRIHQQQADMYALA